MNTDQLIAENNQLQKQLTAVNETYYGDLLVYLRGKAPFYKQWHAETIALEILNDILTAQANGQTAADFFGQKPQSYLDDIIDNLPADSFTRLLRDWSPLLAFLFGTQIYLAGSTNWHTSGFPLGTILLGVAIILILVGLVFLIITRHVYSTWPNAKFNTLLVLLVIPPLAAFIIVNLVAKLGLILLPVWLSLSIAGAVGLFVIGYTTKLHSTPLLIMTTWLVANTVVTQIPDFDNLLNHLATSAIIGIAIGVIVVSLLEWLFMRKFSKN